MPIHTKKTPTEDSPIKSELENIAISMLEHLQAQQNVAKSKSFTFNGYKLEPTFKPLDEASLSKTQPLVKFTLTDKLGAHRANSFIRINDLIAQPSSGNEKISEADNQKQKSFSRKK